MKRFQFRLQRVLKLKQQRERQAELVQQKARLALEQARGEVRVLAERLAESAAAIEKDIGQTIPPDSWMARYHHAAQIGRALEAAEARARHAEERLQEAQRKRARIATEVEALRTLERQEWDKHIDESKRSQQENLDEIGLRRWQAAQANRASSGTTSEAGKE